MTIHYGSESGYSLVPHDNNPLVRRENGLKQLIYRYWCRHDVVDSLIPADDSPAPDDGDLLLKVATVTDRTVDIVDIELVYKQPEDLGWSSLHSVGDTVQEARVDMQEISIDDQRLLDTNGGPRTAAQIASLKANGVLTQKIGGLEYTYTEYFANSYAWTEDNLVANIGDLAEAGFVPAGITAGTYEYWMFMGRDVREEGNVVSVGETWRYSRFGWAGANSNPGTTTTTTT